MTFQPNVVSAMTSEIPAGDFRNKPWQSSGEMRNDTHMADDRPGPPFEAGTIPTGSRSMQSNASCPKHHS